MQDTTCLIGQMDKIYWPQNLRSEFHILGGHEACIAGEMAQGGLNLFLSFYS